MKKNARNKKGAMDGEKKSLSSRSSEGLEKHDKKDDMDANALVSLCSAISCA